MKKNIADRILEKASRPGGVSRHEVTSNTVDRKDRGAASNALEALVQAGAVRLFQRPAKGGTGHPSRQYFVHAADGERWASEVQIKPTKPAPLPRNFATIGAKSRAVSLPPDAEVIVPNDVRVQYGPSHPFDSRYQIDPATRVVGGFASAGIGRYLDSK
jgi:hypothetical protein